MDDTAFTLPSCHNATCCILARVGLLFLSARHTDGRSEHTAPLRTTCRCGQVCSVCLSVCLSTVFRLSATNEAVRSSHDRPTSFVGCTAPAAGRLCAFRYVIYARVLGKEG